MARNKHNTPTTVKYSFWRMAYERKDALYACLNYGEAFAPGEIKKKSICINGDIGAFVRKKKKSRLFFITGIKPRKK